jgi:hypothetical protein
MDIDYLIIQSRLSESYNRNIQLFEAEHIWKLKIYNEFLSFYNKIVTLAERFGSLVISLLLLLY